MSKPNSPRVHGNRSMACFAALGMSVLVLVLLSSQANNSRRQELLLLHKILVNQQRLCQAAGGCSEVNATTTLVQQQAGGQQTASAKASPPAAAQTEAHRQQADTPQSAALGRLGRVHHPAAKAASVNSTISAGGSSKARKYHILTTAGDGLYTRWQTRIHYYWYLRRKAECEQLLGDACEMGGFTRVLHTGKEDELMDEVPTFVAQRVPDSHGDYPVLDQAYAVQQWLEQTNIPENVVMMSEPDQLFIRPLPNLMGPEGRPVLYKFGYMAPAAPNHYPIIAKFLPSKELTAEEAKNIPPVGNSPVFFTLEQMRKIIPLWAELNLAMYKDQEASKAFGWVKAMYAFATAVYVAGYTTHDVDYAQELHACPPYQDQLEYSEGHPFYIAHYSYNAGVLSHSSKTMKPLSDAEKAKAVWFFDKRSYMDKPLPRHLEHPPKNATNPMVRTVMKSINTATENIPCWDEYAKTGVRPTTCDEIIPGTVYPTVPPSSQAGEAATVPDSSKTTEAAE